MDFFHATNMLLYYESSQWKMLRGGWREGGFPGGGTHLSCFRANSSILIRLTRSFFRFSWPFLSPCRKAIWACQHRNNTSYSGAAHKSGGARDNRLLNRRTDGVCVRLEGRVGWLGEDNVVCVRRLKARRGREYQTGMGV